MKIHEITLKDYNQFKDLVIDLTYPQGHPKAGQPLDKVCFIGQSGTGKTSLLRLIKACSTNNRNIGTNIELPPFLDGQVLMKFEIDNLIYSVRPSADTFYITNLLEKETTTEWFDEWKKVKSNHIEQNKPILVNIPTERVVGQNDEFSLETIKEISSEEKNQRINYLESLEPDNYIDFSYDDTLIAWEFVLSDIKKHQADDLDLRNKIANTILNPDSHSNDFELLNKEYQNWLRQNPSPLERLANAMNPILQELGVKIKTDIDRESILHLGNILLQTLEGQTINRSFWSTGTKQIIDTFLPLYELHLKNAIVLIDEPERSLYPNMQQKIIDLYTAQGTDCQFFFATHSPIIASSFDPWEIVELKFDDTYMNVVQETNYTGERHIDNYTVYPKYLRWDGILMKLFDLTDEGNTDHRMEKLMEAATLKRKLNKLKEKGENSGEKFDAMLEKFIKIKSQVGWDEKD